MKLDQFFCELPLVGNVFKRMFSYFRKNTTIADTIHFALGLGVGLLIADKFLEWAYVALAIGILGHIYAYIKG